MQPAFVLQGENDGWFTEMLGVYLEVKRRPYFKLEGQEIFCYPYTFAGNNTVGKLWVIGKTPNDPNGFWIGACESPEDAPTAVRKWATHAPGRPQWVQQPGVSAVPPQMAKRTKAT